MLNDCCNDKRDHTSTKIVDTVLHHYQVRIDDSGNEDDVERALFNEERLQEYAENSRRDKHHYGLYYEVCSQHRFHFESH